MTAATRRLRLLTRQLASERSLDEPRRLRSCTSAGDAASAAAAADALLAEHAPPAGPGCAVCVVRAGVTLYAAGSGMASLEHRVPIAPTTVFDVGSVSKQFTAAAVARLAVEGKLSLDDPVAKHIPTFPDYGAPLTVSHLLHHTSGVRDYLTTMRLAGLRVENVYTEAELVEMICRQKKLNFAPVRSNARSSLAPAAQCVPVGSSRGVADRERSTSTQTRATSCSPPSCGRSAASRSGTTPPTPCSSALGWTAPSSTK